MLSSTHAQCMLMVIQELLVQLSASKQLPLALPVWPPLLISHFLKGGIISKSIDYNTQFNNIGS